MSTINIKILVVLGVMAAFAATSFAGGVGTTGAQFLKIGTGARAVGMGGAFSAVAEGPDAIYWNPAGLAVQTDKQATATYIKYFEGINIGYFGYTQPMFGHGVAGAGVNYLTVGDMDKRAGDTDVRDGTFSASDMALNLAWAGGIGHGVSVGANVKYIKQTIDADSAQSYAIDVAALYATPVEKLTAGLGVFNVGSKVKFIDEEDPLPLDVRLGFAYRMLTDDALIVAADADDYINDSRVYSKLGVEYTYRNMVSVRAGYTFGRDSSKLGGSTGLGTGIGVKVWNIKLDYAFVPFGELTDTHWVSISAKF